MSVTAISQALGERALPPGSAMPEAAAMPMPRGLALSGALHVGVLALVAFGLPVLFHRPPPEDMPIAVQLVTIAPETKATKVNPYRPKPEAKLEAPPAPPAPKPEPKPEPPQPAPEPPPAAAAPAPPPPPPVPKRVEAPTPPPPAPAKPAEAAPPAPPPPPPKPVEAKAPAPPPPPPRPPEHKPKPEPKPETKVAHAAPKHEAKHEPKRHETAAFDALLKDLSDARDKKPEDKKAEPASFDSLLKNLTREHPTPSEDAAPQRPRRTASAAPSAQPKAPLAAQLTANEMDLVREQISHCWNVPAGAREARDLVIEIRVVANPDGSVRQATIVNQGRLADPTFRAAAESARRAFFAPACRPLRLPPGKYEQWKEFVVDFSPKDVL